MPMAPTERSHRCPCEGILVRLSLLPAVCYNWWLTEGARMSSVIPATNDVQPVRERVQTVINLIRPAVQADGGDIELVDVNTAGVVSIRFHGACHGCPSSTMTLQMGIERNLRERVPEVTQVIPVT